jgi:Flp pilus assembly pilin Flp
MDATVIKSRRARAFRGSASGLCDLGGVSIEYALLGAIIALGIVYALQSTRQSLNSNLDKVSYAISKATPTVDKPARVVASTRSDSVGLNGTQLYRTYTTYTDGTQSMVQTNSNNAVMGWSVANYEFDAAGNATSVSVKNPDGSFQYSQLIETVRSGVTVSTITDSSNVPYAFQSTFSSNGAIGTESRVMTMTSGRTDLWTTQVITADYSNPANIVTRATCTYASGQTVSC